MNLTKLENEREKQTNENHSNHIDNRHRNPADYHNRVWILDAVFRNDYQGSRQKLSHDIWSSDSHFCGGYLIPHGPSVDKIKLEVEMSTQILRILIAGALFVHGVGHTLGYWMPARSWLFPNLGEQTLRIISSIFWIVAIVGFLAALLGFLGILVPSDIWRSIAVGSALVSTIGLVLFWNTWPVLNTIGAMGMNIVVLISLLWIHWPPTNMFGK